MRTVSAVILVGLAALAGCVEPAPLAPAAVSESVPSNVLKDGRDLRLDLQESDVIEKPQWSVGDWFGHHVFFDGAGDEGFHINTIVVDDKGDKWTLATDDKQMAKYEAVVDIPIIGPLSKKDLSGTGFGSDFSPYVFPLKHGATWSREVELGDQFSESNKVKVTYEASYNGAISTPDGSRPGFDIVGKTAEGKTLFAYDFVPDIQWYAHFYQYNIVTEDPEDFVFHVMSMGHGSAWTGTYYIDAAKELVQEVHGFAIPDPDGPSTAPFVDPKPYVPFTVASSATYVFGFVFSGAYMGVQETLVIDPQNGQNEFQALSVDPMGFAESGGELDVAAIPGEWKIVGIGAGAVAIWGAFIWEVTETAQTLEATASA